MKPPADEGLLSFFAVCPRGLEPALAEELAALGAADIDPAAGGVAFRGATRVGYAANLHSRIASRVLRLVIEGRYRNDDDIYKIAARAPWEQFLSPELTLRVDLTATRSPLRSLNFATLRVKDGIVDRLRQQFGDRPSIDTVSPDARVFAYLDERLARLYLDWSGESLFKRGWRGEVDAKGEAPIKENLAAGLLALSGWRPGMLLLDPFCGSGTIVIEAAQMAAGVAAGSQRSFGFERLRDHDRGVWRQLREAAQNQAAQATVTPGLIFGSDIDRAAVAQARQNARLAGLRDDAIRFESSAAQRRLAPSAPDGSSLASLIVSNPPYGERIDLQMEVAGDGGRQRAGERQGVGSRPGIGGRAGSDHRSGDRLGSLKPGRAATHRRADDTTALFGALGSHWKQNYLGWQINLLSSDRQLPNQLGLKERRKTPLFNGALECRLFSFQMFERGPAPAAES